MPEPLALDFPVGFGDTERGGETGVLVGQERASRYRAVARCPFPIVVEVRSSRLVSTKRSCGKVCDHNEVLLAPVLGLSVSPTLMRRRSTLTRLLLLYQPMAVAARRPPDYQCTLRLPRPSPRLESGQWPPRQTQAG
jgi:hypothetical protein